MKKHNNQ